MSNESIVVKATIVHNSKTISSDKSTLTVVDSSKTPTYIYGVSKDTTEVSTLKSTDVIVGTSYWVSVEVTNGLSGDVYGFSSSNTSIASDPLNQTHTTSNKIFAPIILKGDGTATITIRNITTDQLIGTVTLTATTPIITVSAATSKIVDPLSQLQVNAGVPFYVATEISKDVTGVEYSIEVETPTPHLTWTIPVKKVAYAGTTLFFELSAVMTSDPTFGWITIVVKRNGVDVGRTNVKVFSNSIAVYASAFNNIDDTGEVDYAKYKSVGLGVGSSFFLHIKLPKRADAISQSSVVKIKEYRNDVLNATLSYTIAGDKKAYTTQITKSDSANGTNYRYVFESITVLDKNLTVVSDDPKVTFYTANYSSYNIYKGANNTTSIVTFGSATQLVGYPTVAVNYMNTGDEIRIDTQHPAFFDLELVDFPTESLEKVNSVTLRATGPVSNFTIKWKLTATPTINGLQSDIRFWGNEVLKNKINVFISAIS